VERAMPPRSLAGLAADAEQGVDFAVFSPNYVAHGRICQTCLFVLTQLPGFCCCHYTVTLLFIVKIL
jgi:hypothetical protein